MDINIAFCTDEKYVVPSLVSLTSIFENNKGNNIHAYILTAGLSKKSKDKYEKLSKAYNQTIQVCTIDDKRLEELKITGRFPTAMYFRFLLPQIVAGDRVLYLDCDIMARQDLSALYSVNLDNLACGVVVDQNCDDVSFRNRLRFEGEYFNSGVLLMNLYYWRKHDVCEKLIAYISANPDKLSFPDQDALNVVLDGKVKYMGYEYNAQEFWVRKLDSAQVLYSKWDGIKSAMENPVLVHFSYSIKPWHKECANPYLDEYLGYAQLHNFLGFKRRHNRMRYIDGVYHLVRRRLVKWLD